MTAQSRYSAMGKSQYSEFNQILLGQEAGKHDSQSGEKQVKMNRTRNERKDNELTDSKTAMVNTLSYF